MGRDTHHVVPNPDGGWDVKRGNGLKASHHTNTKEEAVEIGRKISQNQETEFVVHGKNGRIQTSDSHGKDSRRVKG
ncbi:MAG: DUF2188 domain-containing protein [Clostridia bacterium]